MYKSESEKSTVPSTNSFSANTGNAEFMHFHNETMKNMEILASIRGIPPKALLDQIESDCLAALKIAHKKISETNKLICFSWGYQILGDVHVGRKYLAQSDLLKGHRALLKAVALYSLGLANLQKHNYPSSSNITRQFCEKIQEVENILIASAGGRQLNLSLDEYWKRENETFNILKRIRKTANEEHSALIRGTPDDNIHSPKIKKIYRQISKRLREELILNLINRCFEILPPPKDCVYSIIVLGSLARNEATPYSDFEWAILLEDQGQMSNLANKEYFRRFTELLWLKVLVLQETTARMMDIDTLLWYPESESPTPKGFSFDGQMLSGCHTPLGNKHHTENRISAIQSNPTLTNEEKQQIILDIRDHEYELLGTPEELANYQLPKWEDKVGFTTVLSTVMPIAGNDKKLAQLLVDQYISLMEEIWKTPVLGGFENKKIQSDNSILPLTLLQKRSLKYLSEAIARFEFHGGRFGDEKTLDLQSTHYIDAKYHLYRIPNMFLDNLSSFFYFEVKEFKLENSRFKQSVWDRASIIFGEDDTLSIVNNTAGAKNLQYAISLVLSFRLVAYQFRGKRDDHLVLLGDEIPNEEFDLSELKYFGITRNALHKIFSVLLKFEEILKKFIENSSSRDILASPDFHGLPVVTDSYIDVMLLDFINAEKHIDRYINVLKSNNITGLPLASALNKICRIRLETGYYLKALSNCNEAIRILNANQCQDHIEMAKAKRYLGGALEYKEQYMLAIDAYNEAMAIVDKLYGPGDVTTALILNDLSIVYKQLNQYNDAINTLLRAKMMILSKNNPDDLDIACIELNLGENYLELTEYKRASQHLEEAERIYTTKYGPHHRDVAKVLAAIGGIYARQARYPEAINAYKKAKLILGGIFGSNYFEVAAILTKLGSVYQKQCEYEKAKRSLIKAKNIVIQLNPEHSHLGDILVILSCVHESQKNYAESIKLLEKAKLIYTAKGNNHRSQMSMIYGNLGNIYCLQSRYAAGMLSHKKAKSNFVAVYGVNHIELASSLMNLGMIYYLQGLYDKAIRNYYKSYRILYNKHFDDHPQVGEVFHNLALALIELKRFNGARSYFRKAAAIFKNFQNDFEKKSLFELKLSYFREGNVFLLGSPPNIAQARQFYSHTGAPGDPADPFTHLDVGHFFYNQNDLYPAIERYQIFLLLDSGKDKNAASAAHQKLGCLMHVRAQIEKDRGCFNSFMNYLQVADNHFKRSIKLNSNSNIYLIYAYFIVKNAEVYSTDLAVYFLNKIISLRTQDKSITFVLLDRLGVEEPLQTILDIEEKISLNIHFFSYYLLVQTYVLRRQYQKAKSAFIEYKQHHSEISLSSLEEDLLLNAELSLRELAKSLRTSLTFETSFRFSPIAASFFYLRTIRQQYDIDDPTARIVTGTLQRLCDRTEKPFYAYRRLIDRDILDAVWIVASNDIMSIDGVRQQLQVLNIDSDHLLENNQHYLIVRDINGDQAKSVSYCMNR